ncbi:MAG: hypothetical protein WDN28_21605 [Chthoniobacter sp.]
MAKQPDRFTVPDPQSLFVSCESFRLTTELLKKEISEGRRVYLFSYIANDAFTCELLLKCVDAARSGTHIKGHKLVELFDTLPQPDKDTIEQHWNAQSIGTAESFTASRIADFNIIVVRDDPLLTRRKTDSFQIEFDLFGECIAKNSSRN